MKGVLLVFVFLFEIIIVPWLIFILFVDKIHNDFGASKVLYNIFDSVFKLYA